MACVAGLMGDREDNMDAPSWEEEDGKVAGAATPGWGVGTELTLTCIFDAPPLDAW